MSSILKKFYSSDADKRATDLEIEMRAREERLEAERLARVAKRNERMRRTSERLDAERASEKAWLDARRAMEKVAANRRKSDARGSAVYELVVQFVRRYGIDANQERLNKLIRLIESRGLKLSEAELMELVKAEARKQAEQKVHDLILSSSPTSYKEFVDSFVQSCDSRKSLHAGVLERLLKLHKCHPGIDRQKLTLALRKAEEAAELGAFESQLFDNSNFVYVNDLARYSGVDFEHFLNSLFTKMGYSVELTQTTGDQGADLVIERLGKRSVVQAKRYGGKVGNKAVQEIVAAISFYGADEGIVVTNSYFTPSARALAEANRVSLVDRDKLEELINKHW